MKCFTSELKLMKIGKAVVARKVILHLKQNKVRVKHGKQQKTSNRGRQAGGGGGVGGSV